jgi:hypothetical protein
LKVHDAISKIKKDIFVLKVYEAMSKIKKIYSRTRTVTWAPSVNCKYE